jgi:hypothetical protein
MLVSLHVTKVYWKNCRTATKGQFQGKEKFAAIGPESAVDHSLVLVYSIRLSEHTQLHEKLGEIFNI